MDLQLPGISGLEAIEAIIGEDPSARIIVLTVHQGDEDIYRVLKAGAVTYIIKNTLSEDLVRVVREVHNGGRQLPVDVAGRLAERVRKRTLTPREVEVLQLLGKGLRNKEIGSTLGIAEETAHWYVKNIFTKLEVNDRTAAVTVALRRGIIHLE